MKSIFDHLSLQCSRLTTQAYSTSFTVGIWCLHKTLRDPIYSVYGFVRFADEIVDSFHQHNQAQLLGRFRRDTYQAIEEGVSLNPILNAYQATVHRYGIPLQLTDLFLDSMEMDLSKKSYSETELQQYITGSAEAVGLMCLHIFCDRDEDMYHRLEPSARSLGSAFQKVNFLRDLKADLRGLGRSYFQPMEASAPEHFCKQAIEDSIKADLDHALKGIKKLPQSARFGVYVAYMYYLALFKKIRNTPAEKVLQTRIRIPNRYKATLLAYSFVKHQLNWI